MILRAFIGYTYKKAGAYSMCVYQDNQYVQMKPKLIKSKDPKYIILFALIELLEEIVSIKDSSKIEITYYCNNDEIAFEWHEEYLNTKEFSKQTAHLPLWKKIISLTENNGISLTVKGKTILEKYNKRQNLKAMRYGTSTTT